MHTSISIFCVMQAVLPTYLYAKDADQGDEVMVIVLPRSVAMNSMGPHDGDNIKATLPGLHYREDG